MTPPKPEWQERFIAKFTLEWKGTRWIPGYTPAEIYFPFISDLLESETKKAREEGYAKAYQDIKEATENILPKQP